MFVDLDYFGAINKASGQDEGDRTLRRAASAVGSAMRERDVVYRIGGEELVALIPDAGAGLGLAIARRMRDALAAMRLPHPAHPTSAVVTASIGVAEYDRGRHVRGEDVVDAADEAMRVAKAAGRDRIAVAEPGGAAVADEPTAR